MSNKHEKNTIEEKLCHDLLAVVDNYEQIHPLEMVAQLMTVAFGVMAATAPSPEEGCEEMQDILDRLAENWEWEEDSDDDFDDEESDDE